LAEPGVEARVQIGEGFARTRRVHHAVLALRAIATSFVAYCLSVVAWVATALTLLPVAFERGPLGRRPVVRAEREEIAEPLPRKALRR
jgi:hypothetical protein